MNVVDLERLPGRLRGAPLMALLSIALLSGPPAAMAVDVPDQQADVVVVGAGIAGLSAAWQAAQVGARVTVVDMWSVFGGHALMSQGGLCIVGTPVQEAQGLHDTPDLAFKDFVDWGEDPRTEWVRYYVEHSRGEIYDWLTGMGVTFDEVIPVQGNSVARFHQTHGRGVALVSPIYRACVSDPHVRFVWNLEVTGLVRDGARVVGIHGREMRSGRSRELRARATILATGGFQSNLEMVRTFWPSAVPFPARILAGSGVNSQGSGLAIAQAAGAVLQNMDHQWNYATGLPDPRYPGLPRGLSASNPASIWLNAEGRRFVDESVSQRFKLEALLKQTRATYWAVFDEAGKREFNISGSDWGDFATVERVIFGNPKLVQKADSIDALAQRIGLPAAAVRASVARFNAMIATGRDADFGRFGRPGEPVPARIETPPFYAMQFFPLARKSMGGVLIDTAARVVDGGGKPIPGLYAAGELTGLAGINGKAGLEGTFLGPSIVTGRVAGRTVVADFGDAPKAEEVQAQPKLAAAGPGVARAPARYQRTTYCQSCHNLSAAIATPRPGYTHFERVHGVVLERKYECLQCHAGIGRYEPGAHRIDPLAHIATCVKCHVAVEH
jgi:flavocytochrome c